MDKIRVPLVFLFPFFQHGDRQKTSVQHEQAVAKIDRGPEAVTQHLHHMGNGLIPFPATDLLIPVMDLNGKGKAEGFCQASNQYTDSTKEMAMDKLLF